MTLRLKHIAFPSNINIITLPRISSSTFYVPLSMFLCSYDKFDKSSNISLYDKNAHKIKNCHTAKILLILVLIK